MSKMKHRSDTEGLREHLVSHGLIPDTAEILDSATFEEKLSEMSAVAAAGPSL